MALGAGCSVWVSESRDKARYAGPPGVDLASPPSRSGSLANRNGGLRALSSLILRAIPNRPVLAGIFWLLWAACGLAAEWRVELDPAATTISFELGATLHTVHGTARLSEGWLVLDPDSGAVSGRIAVDATSLETAHQGRDTKMHEKVLESDEYPEMAFLPRSMSGELKGEGASRLTLDGAFAIHGEEHPLSVEVLVRVEGDSLRAEVELEVPYVLWGLEDPSKFVLRVAKEVQVRIEGVGRLTPAAIQEADS